MHLASVGKFVLLVLARWCGGNVFVKYIYIAVFKCFVCYIKAVWHWKI